MTPAFEQCLRVIREWEGWFSSRPLSDDPGGLTVGGITQPTLAAYRRTSGHAEIPASVTNMTHDLQARILHDQYWVPCKCDDLPLPLALVTFDAAVMSGPFDGSVGHFLDDAIEWLQAALQVTVDGKVGPKTIAAAAAADLAIVIPEIQYQRLRYYSTLKHFHANPGWIRRMLNIQWIAESWYYIENTPKGVIDMAKKPKKLQPSLPQKIPSVSLRVLASDLVDNDPVDLAERIKEFFAALRNDERPDEEEPVVSTV